MLPPPHGFSYTEERTYQDLLATLGEQPSVWCQCLFVDPIADIAVLGTPRRNRNGSVGAARMPGLCVVAE
jgi:hypothetical protein